MQPDDYKQIQKTLNVPYHTETLNQNSEHAPEDQVRQICGAIVFSLPEWFKPYPDANTRQYPESIMTFDVQLDSPSKKKPTHGTA